MDSNCHNKHWTTITFRTSRKSRRPVGQARRRLAPAATLNNGFAASVGHAQRAAHLVGGPGGGQRPQPQRARGGGPAGREGRRARLVRHVRRRHAARDALPALARLARLALLPRLPDLACATLRTKYNNKNNSLFVRIWYTEILLLEFGSNLLQ